MDRLDADRRSRNMARIRAKDTRPEWAVRRLVHRMGYRYALHRSDLPGKPDLVFASRRKIIFVHGCFWHQHPKASCVDSRLPKSRLDYWLPKLNRTMVRDREHVRLLKRDGWRVLVVWECDTENEAALSRRIGRFLGPGVQVKS
jgi:DNA mismatch endonuclease (patch repair protein)